MTTREEAGAHGDNVFFVSHAFDAPRESVWRAFTEPQLMAQWFAPKPLTVPRAEMDLRPGGRYTLVMRDPDGSEFPSTGQFREISPPERLVYTDSVDVMPREWVDMVNKWRGKEPGTPVPDGIVTVTFHDTGANRTHLTFQVEYDSKETRDAYLEMGMLEGLEDSFENLEQVLARTPSMAR